MKETTPGKLTIQAMTPNASKSFNGTFYLNPKSDSYVVKNPKMNVYVVTKGSDGVVYGVDPNEDLSALNLVASDYFKVKFPKEIFKTGIHFK